MAETNSNANAGATGESKNTTQEQEQNTSTQTEKTEHMIPKSRFDQVVNQRKEAETALEDIAKELAEEVPEDMRDLIPELPAAKKIQWLRAATKKGLFNGNAPSSSPDSKRTGGKPPLDFSNMNPVTMMAHGYSKQQ